MVGAKNENMRNIQSTIEAKKSINADCVIIELAPVSGAWVISKPVTFNLACDLWATLTGGIKNECKIMTVSEAIKINSLIGNEYMNQIEIKHSSEGTTHVFTVNNPNLLSRVEIDLICQEMNLKAIFVNGKIYKA
jgi:hypothetical protein